MKGDGGLARARASDLDLSPADAADTESKHLRYGLFRSPPPGEMKHVRPAIHLLPLRVDAIEKSPGMLLEHIADARGLDDVDADL